MPSIIKFSAAASVVIKDTKLNQVGKAITFQHIKNLPNEVQNFAQDKINTQK